MNLAQWQCVQGPGSNPSTKKNRNKIPVRFSVSFYIGLLSNSSILDKVVFSWGSMVWNWIISTSSGTSEGRWECAKESFTGNNQKNTTQYAVSTGFFLLFLNATFKLYFLTFTCFCTHMSHACTGKNKNQTGFQFPWSWSYLQLWPEVTN